MAKTAIAIRHVAFEDLGSFAEPLAQHGYHVRYIDTGIDDLTFATHVDMLIVLGGPISSNDEARYPWLRDEIELIRQRIVRGLPVLGICLGAQLIARALGARVYAASAKEIGFAPIDLTPEGRQSPLAALASGPVLHWHGETFDLPPDARRLASTAICETQAFSLGARVMACQFHPEAGDGRFERWLIGHHGELAMDGIDINQLRAMEQRERDGLRARGNTFLSNWLDRLA